MTKRFSSCVKIFTLSVVLTLSLVVMPAQGQSGSATFAEQFKAAGKREEINLFDVTASVDQDGSVTVRERIEVTVLGKEIKRGIIRKFPTDYEASDGRTIRTDFELISTKLDGKDVQNSLDRQGIHMEIRLGSKDEMVARGRHVYEIVYKTMGWIAFREDFDEFYWNVTGNEWTFPIKKAAYRIVLPEGGTIIKSVGYTGYKGDRGDDFKKLPDGSFVTTRELKQGEGLTVAAAWEKGLVAKPSLPMMAQLEEFFYTNKDLIVVFLVGITALYYGVVWLLRGRDKIAGPVIPLFSPPVGCEAGYIKYFKDREYATEDLAANILQLAVTGAVRFSGGESNLKIHPSGKTAEELKLAPPLAEIYEKIQGKGELAVDESSGIVFYEMEQALQGAYKERGKDHFVSNASLAALGLTPLLVLVLSSFWFGGPIFRFLGSDSAIFAPIAILILMCLGYLMVNRFRELLKDGLKGLEGFEWVQLMILIFFIISAISFLGLFFHYDPFFTGGVTIIVALVYYFFRKIQSRTTEAGAELGREIDGLAMYIGTAERHRLPMINPPDETPQLFEKLLPFAFALGLTKTWADSFSSVLEAASYSPEWSDSYTDATSLSMLVYSISGSIGDSRSSYSPPSKSSSYGGRSGFGGGGSSGGGGGGGGGSGW